MHDESAKKKKYNVRMISVLSFLAYFINNLDGLKIIFKSIL